jgi:Chitobiase/beta-hexosaminidase C-terminal domain
MRSPHVRLTGGRRKVATATASLALLGAAAGATPAAADVAAGRSLELDSSIEMGVLEGYPAQDVRVQVFRGSTLIAEKTITGGGAGSTVDINHVGGDDCWAGVPAGRSPDVKGGDHLVATVLDALGAPTADVDDLWVRNINFTDGATWNGTAFGMPAGAGFNLAAAMAGEGLEGQRRTSDGERHDFAATVGADGSFSGAVTGAVGDGEAFINHLDERGGGTAITTRSPGADEGSACGERVTTALSSVSHGAINAASVGTDLVVGGPRLAPTTVESVTFGGRTYSPTNNADTWTATIPAADLAALPNNADHALVANFSAGPPDSRTIRKDVSPPVVGASMAPGTYAQTTPPRSVALSADTGEQVRYTLDGSLPQAFSSTPYLGVPIGLGAGTTTVRAFAVDAVGNRGDATFAYTIATAGQGAGAGAGGQVRPGATRTPGLRLLRMSLRSVLPRSVARRSGVRASLRLARGTRVVEARLFRGRRLIARVTRNVGTRRTYVLRLNSRAIRRALTRGRYQLRVRAGTSRTTLGPASIRAFRVR